MKNTDSAETGTTIAGITQIADVETPSNPYELLSSTQKQRADYLNRMIGDHALELVRLMDSRGRNSWPIVYEKVMNINQANVADEQYHSSIYENFSIGDTYTSADIISIIAEIRQDLKLVPYLNNTKNNCEQDLFKLFLIKEVFEEVPGEGGGKPTKRLVGYKPLISIRPGN